MTLSDKPDVQDHIQNVKPDPDVKPKPTKRRKTTANVVPKEPKPKRTPNKIKTNPVEPFSPLKAKQKKTRTRRPKQTDSSPSRSTVLLCSSSAPFSSSPPTSVSGYSNENPNDHMNLKSIPSLFQSLLSSQKVSHRKRKLAQEEEEEEEARLGLEFMDCTPPRPFVYDPYSEGMLKNLTWECTRDSKDWKLSAIPWLATSGASSSPQYRMDHEGNVVKLLNCRSGALDGDELSACFLSSSPHRPL
ncbi:hypothetical protein C8Q75DRAFT_354685 [Abortiporus biennis]|nr:hypothetical protein C8Q75DRAFT_354685 [Abortiporus biennis]